MKKEDLIDALGEINEEYITDADQIRRPVSRKRMPVWILSFAAAAVAGIVFLPSLLSPKTAGSGSAAKDDTVQEAAVMNEAENVEEEAADHAEYVYTYTPPGIPGTWEKIEQMETVRIYELTPLSEEEAASSLLDTAGLLSLETGQTVSADQCVISETESSTIRTGLDGITEITYPEGKEPDGQDTIDSVSSLWDEPAVYETEFYDQAGEFLYTRCLIQDASLSDSAEILLNQDYHVTRITIYGFKKDRPIERPAVPTDTILKDINREEDTLPPAEISYVLRDEQWVPVVTVYSLADESVALAWKTDVRELAE